MKCIRIMKPLHACLEGKPRFSASILLYFYKQYTEALMRRKELIAYKLYPADLNKCGTEAHLPLSFHWCDIALFFLPSPSYSYCRKGAIWKNPFAKKFLLLLSSSGGPFRKLIECSRPRVNWGLNGADDMRKWAKSPTNPWVAKMPPDLEDGDLKLRTQLVFPFFPSHRTR